MKFYQFFLFVVVFFTYSSLNAGEMQKFGDIDENADGFISQTEANDHDKIKTNWKAADMDKNGKLDRSEFSAFESSKVFQPVEPEDPEPGAAPTD